MKTKQYVLESFLLISLIHFCFGFRIHIYDTFSALFNNFKLQVMHTLIWWQLQKISLGTCARTYRPWAR